MKKVFIDGSAGTTGLRIFERLSERNDISLITLPEDLRKSQEHRKNALNDADIAFLCLPDAAAAEAVSFVENQNTVIIDTSTAHRTNPGWAYGFPELSEDLKEKILSSNRIAVPGCHASGFTALIHPLVKAGLLSGDADLTCHSITGYSGGGKKMIAQYEEKGNDCLFAAPRQYALSQNHKHLKEMMCFTSLKKAPVFCPIVSNFYSGMLVTVPLHKSALSYGGIDDIKEIYKKSYSGKIVYYEDNADESGFLSSAAKSGKDSMQISVYGNDERIILTARYDNLGKGASGAAVECLNLKLGVSETENLVL